MRACNVDLMSMKKLLLQKKQKQAGPMMSSDGLIDRSIDRSKRVCPVPRAGARRTGKIRGHMPACNVWPAGPYDLLLSPSRGFSPIWKSNRLPQIRPRKRKRRVVVARRRWPITNAANPSSHLPPTFDQVFIALLLSDLPSIHYPSWPC